MIHKYTPDEARNLKTYGELKSDFQIHETQAGDGGELPHPKNSELIGQRDRATRRVGSISKRRISTISVGSTGDHLLCGLTLIGLLSGLLTRVHRIVLLRWVSCAACAVTYRIFSASCMILRWRAALALPEALKQSSIALVPSLHSAPFPLSNVSLDSKPNLHLHHSLASESIPTCLLLNQSTSTPSSPCNIPQIPFQRSPQTAPR